MCQSAICYVTIAEGVNVALQEPVGRMHVDWDDWDTWDTWDSVCSGSLITMGNGMHRDYQRGKGLRLP